MGQYMEKEIKVETERVDDIPLLLEQLKKMNVQEIFDEVFATHGNWQGLSAGFVVIVWLSHILSQGDHRLNQVENWADSRLETLGSCINQEVRSLDFSDDRLSDILKLLSDDENWANFEQSLNGHTLRVYNLTGEPIRIDSTTASGYWTVTEEGIFQLGHSKDHRPDLPQVKVNLSTLDPLGMPLVTQVLAGNAADDPLYIPAITAIKESVGGSGLLYIGDCKMAAVATRAFISNAGDFYLCPLSALQFSSDQLDIELTRALANAEQEPLIAIYRKNCDGEEELIAEGFEVSEIIRTEVDGQQIVWQERRLIIHSLSLAETEKRHLDKRLKKAEAQLGAINERKRGKKRPRNVEEVKAKVESILNKYRVVGLINCNIVETIRQRKKRRYKDRPEQLVEEKEFEVTVSIDVAEVEKVKQRLGWRVYATNHSAQELSLEQAVLAYRSQYIIERDFGRLKGKQLSLSPSYLHRPDHVVGLVRLLSIALRVLTLVEFVVRRNLANEQQELAGLYRGNPKRATARPTAEILLQAFKNITLTNVHIPGQVIAHIPPLSQLQRRILALLELQPEVYRLSQVMDDSNVVLTGRAKKSYTASQR